MLRRRHGDDYHVGSDPALQLREVTVDRKWPPPRSERLSCARIDATYNSGVSTVFEGPDVTTGHRAEANDNHVINRSVAPVHPSPFLAITEVQRPAAAEAEPSHCASPASVVSISRTPASAGAHHATTCNQK